MFDLVWFGLVLFLVEALDFFGLGLAGSVNQSSILKLSPLPPITHNTFIVNVIVKPFFISSIYISVILNHKMNPYL